jgi:peptide/nickel transport system substrate-binding protein
MRVAELRLTVAVLAGALGCSRGHAHGNGPDAGQHPTSSSCPPPPPALRLDPAAPALPSMPPSSRGMVVQLDAEPPTLLPLLRPDWMAWTILGHLVEESLIRVDPHTGALLPELAEKWEVDESHVLWRFHLRRDAFWHDGHPFTADDVLFTFERLLDPDVGAADRALFAGAQVTKVGPYDVEVRLRVPLASAALDFDRLLILPRHRFPFVDLTRSADANAPVGTGPMRFVSWARGVQITLERQDHYWGLPAPLASLTFRFIASPSALIAALERGDVDIVPRTTEDVAERIDADPSLSSYALVRAAGFDYTAWLHNVASSRLADVRIRRAIGLAIPREPLRADVEHCGVVVAVGPLPPGHPALLGVEPPRFDPGEAARLLDEAGIVDTDGDGKRDKSGAPFVLKLLYPASSREQERAATVIVDELRRLGLLLELVPLEWAQFLRRLESHDFDLAAIQWSIDAEPDLFPLFHSTQVVGSLNYGGYADPEVDSWLEELRTEEPTARRNELLRDVVLRVRRDEPYTFLFSPLTIAVVRRGAYGVTPTALGWEPRLWAWGAPP